MWVPAPEEAARDDDEEGLVVRAPKIGVVVPEADERPRPLVGGSGTVGSGTDDVDGGVNGLARREDRDAERFLAGVGLVLVGTVGSGAVCGVGEAVGVER